MLDKIIIEFTDLTEEQVEDLKTECPIIYKYYLIFAKQVYELQLIKKLNKLKNE